MKIRYAVYARYSTDRQNESSIDDQVRRCTEFANARDGEIVAVYPDAAESGATFRRRKELQRLLADAETGKLRPFDRVLVDDLSRLSREMLTSLSIIFDRLKNAGVPVVDRSSGQSSADPQALVYFTALGLAGHLQREASRHQTHRGLEGLFLKGQSTGGRTIGFATVDGRPTVDAVTAPIVVRIFNEFANGSGFKRIASRLNDDGVPAPYDKTNHRKPRGPGWSHSTVRTILLNERYIGKWSWNRRAFDRRSRGAFESRIPRLRDASEVVTGDRPELRIVPQELWDTVQARFAEKRSRKGGRAPGEAKRPYLVGGLLVCGLCGSHFGIVGSKRKGEHVYRQLGCSAHQSRGPSVCGNNLTIAEKKLSDAFGDALRETLSSPGRIEKMKASFTQTAKRLLAAKPETNEEVLLKEQGTLQKARANLMRLIEASDPPDVDAMARYTDLGKRLAVVTAELKALQPTQEVNVEVIPSAVDKYLRELREVVAGDAQAANAALRKVCPEKFSMVPKTEGPNRFYEVVGALELLPSLTLSGSSEGLCCGGRI